MSAMSPLEAVERVDEAFNRGDLEALLDCYEDEATVVLEPGRLATGKAELRRAFEFILKLKGIARQEKTHVMEACGLALFTSQWSFSGTAPDGSPLRRDSYASTVLRRQSDGRWLIVLDNSWGPAVLG